MTAIGTNVIKYGKYCLLYCTRYSKYSLNEVGGNSTTFINHVNQKETRRIPAIKSIQMKFHNG